MPAETHPERRVILTRPRADAAPLADRLAEGGIDSLIEPMMTVTDRGPRQLDLAGVQAVLVTSANGARALAGRTADDAEVADRPHRTRVGLRGLDDLLERRALEREADPRLVVRRGGTRARSLRDDVTRLMRDDLGVTP